jgi:DNA-binding transcriptional LysR family regulator
MFLWEGVTEFVTVAQTHSFTQAAQRLGISTAQVSRQISALERRLNEKLFYRTTRKVSLTQSGHVYYQHCHQLIEGLEAAERAMSNLHDHPRGLIKITAPVTYGEERIVPLINDFALKYPQVEVKIHLSNQTINLVEDGYDLAIRIGNLNDSSMMAKKLSLRILHTCASPAYIETFGAPHTPSELEQHNCLLSTKDYWRFQELKKQKNIRVSGTLKCNSGYGLVDAALKGMGIIQLPDFYVQAHIESGRLLSLLDVYREDEEGIWAVYPNNRMLSGKVRLLVDFLEQGIKTPQGINT